VFALRPSSFFNLVQPKQEPVARVEVSDLEAQPQEPFIDQGLDIPESYEVDIIRALLQDPFRIFIYWSVRDASIKSLTHYFSPEDVASFRTTLKLFELGGMHHAYFDVGRRGRYWMTVFPDREYEFELGLRSQEHGYIALVRSNRVRTPRGTVSPITAHQAEYRMTGSQFIEVLDASGFGAQQTLDLTVSALPGAIGVLDPLESLLAKLPESVRKAVLLAARGGVLTRELIDEFPEPLRTSLLGFLRDKRGNLATAAFMHYLPEVLRAVLDDDRELVSDHAHPVHFAPRFFAAGSENVMWPGSELHLPSRPSSSDLVRPNR
jgi:hypothetical protein